MLPLSGRNGFMIWNSFEIPIYSWNFSNRRNHITIYDASSDNYPIRVSGTKVATLTIRGVQEIPPFVFDPNFLSSFNFTIGWIDFTVGFRRYLPITAMISEFVYEINYGNIGLPSLVWSATFVDALVDTEFDVSDINIDDVMWCDTSMCSKVITTTDTALHHGFVHHVRSLVLRETYQRPLIYTADSNNHYTVVKPILDKTLDLLIDGDFDYWLAKSNDNDIDDYRIYYEETNYLDVPSMKVIELSSLNVNVQTADLVSANVSLGISNG